ncbi:MAG: DUF559 domain-containing protein [Micromonosporaceae bacterium]|nr:DUF559 domain-containing protein [Micromonosporaceae bacterium]
MTRSQALRAGFTDDAVKVRLRAGRWQRIFSGIYAIYTGEIRRETRQWAAVLHAGPAAVLSHETAAELCGLLDTPVASVHVTIGRHQRIISKPGLTIHRSSTVDQARHPTRVPPQTRVEDTVIDLSQRASSINQAVGWLTRACQRRLTTPARLIDALARRQRVHWRRELSEAIEDTALGCHSTLEWLYLQRVERHHHLPQGHRQAVGTTRPSAGGSPRRRYDDVRYEDWRLSVELDGRATHTDETRHRDQRRDNASVAAGTRVLRYGWDDVVNHPCEVAAEVAATLRRGGWQGKIRRCGPTCTIDA